MALEAARMRMETGASVGLMARVVQCAATTMGIYANAPRMLKAACLKMEAVQVMCRAWMKRILGCWYLVNELVFAE